MIILYKQFYEKYNDKYHTIVINSCHSNILIIFNELSYRIFFHKHFYQCLSDSGFDGKQSV